MDQSPMAVRNLTLRVDFKRTSGGSSVASTSSVAYRGVDWYWFTTGVSRVVKAGLGSLQENWRSGTLPTSSVLRAIANGAMPQILAFRRAVEAHDAGSFAALEAHLETVPLAAPFYVAAAGAQGEGVVIARSPDGVDGRQTLGGADGRRSGAANGSWFLVQTNYDHWVPDPPADPRRSRAEAFLADAGPALGGTPTGLVAVASAYPVHNPHTAYTALMDPLTGELTAFVRDALCPLDPAIARLDPRYCTEEGAGGRLT